uniref:Uncharacterized protein n=1 Tax=Rhizophora mucronata TaxID=61149 RepID=A0A2P2PK49_RHIMU
MCFQNLLTNLRFLWQVRLMERIKSKKVKNDQGFPQFFHLIQNFENWLVLSIVPEDYAGKRYQCMHKLCELRLDTKPESNLGKYN